MHADQLTLITLIDAALPQWQCAQCGTPGCLPYAEAIVKGEAINLCVPGGDPMVKTLAALTNRPALPVALGSYPLLEDGRPQAVRAVIRADECIGCTKCIDACPVDAILGSGKMMHTVLTDLCTGCELCLPPCPVDCIDLIPLDQETQGTTFIKLRDQQFKQDQIDLRQRFTAKQLRETAKHSIKLSASRFTDQNAILPSMIKKQEEPAALVDNAPTQNLPTASTAAIKQPPDPIIQIQLATLRSQIKKLEKQLSVMPNDEKKKSDLVRLQTELARLAPE
jgi:electron transport complex protein RnfB